MVARPRGRHCGLDKPLKQCVPDTRDVGSSVAEFGSLGTVFGDVQVADSGGL
jgi:hypothetical protein